jgi:predicted ester cyclase
LPTIHGVTSSSIVSAAAICGRHPANDFDFPLLAWHRIAMRKTSIALLALTLIGLPVRSDAQGATAAEPSAQQKAALSYLHDVLDGGKIDLVDSIFQPDCEIHFGSSEVKGISGVRSVVERRIATYSKLATLVHDIFESGDRVVVRLTHQAMGAGVLRSRIGTHDINGKSLTWDAIVIFRMKNGKIAEEWVSRDELGMLLCAGILKAN